MTHSDEIIMLTTELKRLRMNNLKLKLYFQVLFEDPRGTAARKIRQRFPAIKDVQRELVLALLN